MQRNDQKLLNYYYKVARECAKRHMLVDFHGAQRGASLTRTWPNLINNEGVRGMEWSKWSVETDPPHNVTLPFTRMFLGPMDYTPGAMLNATKFDLCADSLAPDGARNALPATCYVRRLRKAHCRCFRTVHRTMSVSLSRWSFCARFQPRGTKPFRSMERLPNSWRFCSAQWKRLVRGRNDELGRPRCEDRFVVFTRGNFTMGRVSRRRERRPDGQRLQKTTTTVTKNTKLKIHPGSGRRLGGAHSSVGIFN